MYAIRSYYARGRDLVARLRSLIPRQMFDVAIQAAIGRRITSYNVCYTKLLRFGSLDYDFKAYQSADVVKLDILINGERVDALSSMVHRASAQARGRDLVARLLV